MARVEDVEKAVKAIAVHVSGEFKDVNKKLDEINQKLEKSKDLDEKLRKLEEKMALARGKGKVPSGFIEKLEGLETRISSLSGIDEKISSQDAKLAELEKKISAAPQIMPADIGKMLDEKLQVKMSEIKPAQAPDMSVELKNLRSQIESIGASSKDDRIVSLEVMFKKEVSRLEEDMQKKLAEPHDAEKRLEFLEGRLKNAQKTEKDMQEEGVVLASIDKKMQDMDLLTKDIETKIEHVERLEKQLEKSLNEKATKIFTKHLDDFSRVMDRRFPALVSREDLYKTVSEINSRLDVIEAPDLTPLSQKVDYLEKKIEAIHDMLRSMSSRIPVIVE